MKSGSSGLQQHEYFLVQVDGRTKSGIGASSMHCARACS